MKELLSVILCAAMLFCIMPITVLFTDSGNWPYIQYSGTKKGFILKTHLSNS